MLHQLRFWLGKLPTVDTGSDWFYYFSSSFLPRRFSSPASSSSPPPSHGRGAPPPRRPSPTLASMSAPSLPTKDPFHPRTPLQAVAASHGRAPWPCAWPHPRRLATPHPRPWPRAFQPATSHAFFSSREHVRGGRKMTDIVRWALSQEQNRPYQQKCPCVDMELPH